ncbi:MAG: 4-hydroxy-tetrahydrodipicolinate reductase [Planctomycetes bacterium]|nr:4-hydroxy-tetrahydrodipicolinate reductase [Planctomycetota bacterium]
MIRVLVNGAKGRMGREVVRAVRNESDLSVVSETDLGDDLAAALRASGAEVAVDFTRPADCVANAETILRAGVRPVIGTTGFDRSDVERLRRVAEANGVGGLIAPNFAIGAVLLMRFAAEASRHFPTVEIIELHHDRKLDAPSGTAMLTAERIAAERTGGEPPEAGEEKIPGVRGGVADGIRVHSVRLQGLVAHQEVILGGLGQTLTIRHDSISRESFMPGVILAIRRVPELKTLVFGLDEIL